MINKLLYRSRQRGFLELDLMVGLWAEREVPKMTYDMLNRFAQILELVRVKNVNGASHLLHMVHV
jgi:succinate dehydrogenase flavin-adding protein (antitoxin of CptAB toxin-antitoxin module)